MHKINHLHLSLPSAVKETVPINAPKVGDDHVSCQDWLKKFGNPFHNKSIFYKGPLLAIDTITAPLATSNTLFSNIKPYKNNVTKMLLSLQSTGDPNEWQADNFLLYNIKGLRRSTRP